MISDSSRSIWGWQEAKSHRSTDRMAPSLGRFPETSGPQYLDQAGKAKVSTKMFKADLDDFLATRARTLAMVEGLTQAQSDYASGAARWSTGELLDHITLAERIFRDEIAQLIERKKAGQKPVLNRSFRDLDVSIAYIPKPLLPLVEIPFSLFNMFVPSAARELMMRYRLIPAQNPAVAKPRKGRPITGLRKELRPSLQETEALFEANPSLNYREMVDEHPLLGTNNVLQLLRLLRFHEQRHQSQISDILRDLRFPKASRDIEDPRLSSYTATPGRGARENVRPAKLGKDYGDFTSQRSSRTSSANCHHPTDCHPGGGKVLRCGFPSRRPAGCLWRNRCRVDPWAVALRQPLPQTLSAGLSSLCRTHI